MKKLFAAALALVFFSASSALAADLPQAGTKAPAFTLPSQDGTNVSLKDFKGKWVVLYFYPKDFTSGCSIEAHNFQNDEAKYKAKNAVIVGVSVDSVESHKSFCTKQGLDFKLLADTDHKVSESYGSTLNLGIAVIAARNTFVIDPKGVIRKAYSGVKPMDHSKEVLADLDALQADK